ncbi:MetQ/NlpA family ABC transporter substrate-binding protein [Ligilactobacillus acidipiscis]|uniref:MetQ/NlpA family ABC transporter substrate-binding protein n=1 Tax=Ligilactobacillus acidipiscis TaxID=89059 RepID=UPI0023F903CF|nr:MetQ/NlpA family ABC transporter substrate-binding protein [Ligilactobacillus acidipiscis]WEV58211.1 MetQ/NlpA family ABC transporter substrate-binding protein [Ligilactobacillus acidipiscis]
MKKSVKYLIGTLVVIIIVVAGYFSFGGAGKKQSKTLTVGLVAPTNKDTQIWNTVKKQAKEKYNLTVKTKEFTDWNQPNKSVANGEIDVNSFQTQDFLNQYNKANSNKLTSVGQTVITPLRLYSKKVTKVSEIKNGATITISNDAANEARGLKLLQSAGLVKLAPGKSLATVKDITSNPKNLKIKEVDGSQTARSLPSVDAAVINGGFASSGKINLKYTLFKEKLDKNAKPYINVLAVAKNNKNKQAYRDLAKAYQTSAVKKQIQKEFGPLILPAWTLKIAD